MKKIIALLLALCMVFALVACGSSSSTTTTTTTETTTTETTEAAEDAGTYVFGFSGPLTGGAAIYGNAAKNGAQIAVDEINALGGAQINFIPEDDEHDAEKAINAYNTLMDAGMQVMIGTVTSTPCAAMAAQSYQDRVFCMTPSASSLAVIEGKDNMYQVCFTDPNQGIASADYMAEHYADAKIAVIYKNDDNYSQGIRDTFVTEAAAKGLEVVYEGTFTDGTATDFSVQLTAAQAAEADLLFLPIYYTPASIILTQANTMGYAPTVFGVDGMDGILSQEGFDTSLAEGVLLLTPFSADATDERTQNFVKTYEANYGETPNQFAADAYDAVYIVYTALETAGCTPAMSADEICEALIATISSPDFSVDGITGQGMTWAATGEVSKAPMAVVIKDGVYVTPED